MLDIFYEIAIIRIRRRENMEVHTLVNASAFNELRKDLLKPNIRKLFYAITIILMLLGVFFIAVKFYSTMIICFVGAIILTVELYLISKKQVKVMTKRLYEMYKTDQVEGKLIFTDDMLKTVNLVTKGELNLSYDIMSRFVETDNYYTLFTKEYQMIIIDKQQFDSQTRTQFLQLVNEKMPQLLKK